MNSQFMHAHNHQFRVITCTEGWSTAGQHFGHRACFTPITNVWGILNFCLDWRHFDTKECVHITFPLQLGSKRDNEVVHKKCIFAH